MDTCFLHKKCVVLEVKASQDISWHWKQLIKLKDEVKNKFVGSSWKHNPTGIYSLNSGYKWFTGLRSRVPITDFIWSKWNVPKHSFINWLFWKKKLLTRDRLDHQKLLKDRDECGICGQ